MYRIVAFFINNNNNNNKTETGQVRVLPSCKGFPMRYLMAFVNYTYSHRQFLYIKENYKITCKYFNSYLLLYTFSRVMRHSREVSLN